MSASKFVLVADVVRSSTVEGFAAARDSRLSALSDRHLAGRWIDVPYTITAWDEFQTVVAGPREVPRVVWGLRLGFRPMQVRIGVGRGSIASMPEGNEALNAAGSGPAFSRAREAIEALKRRVGKYDVLTCFRGADPDDEAVANGLLKLVDTLLLRVSLRQWETVVEVERASAQERAAAALGVDESTVSRNLRRAAYWQVKEALDLLGAFLDGLDRRVREDASSVGCTGMSQ